MPVIYKKHLLYQAWRFLWRSENGPFNWYISWNSFKLSCERLNCICAMKAGIHRTIDDLLIMYLASTDCTWLLMYYLQNDTRKRKTSEILAIIAIILLIIDTAGTFLAQGGGRFLPLSDQQSGILLGISSIILFFLSFGIGYRQKTRITTVLLIAGGLILAISKLIEPTMRLNLFLAVALPYLYVSLIVIGFILTGLGLLRVVRRQWR